MKRNINSSTRRQRFTLKELPAVIRVKGKAFTLIELLVVIAILAEGFWVACAVPAQKAKTAAGANDTILEN